MSQRSLKRLLFVTLLAGGLALTGPSQVHAAPAGPVQGAWEWLTRVWKERVTVLWKQPVTEHFISPERRHQNKQGGCIDPNGCANPGGPVSGVTACHAWTDVGVCVDPNG